MMPIAARGWSAAFALAVLALPWFGHEDPVVALFAGEALPLVFHAGARPWLRRSCERRSRYST